MKEVFKDDDRNIDENFIEMHDEWVEMGYGFMTPLAYENQEWQILYDLDNVPDVEVFFNVECSDGELLIKSDHPNLTKILNTFKDFSDVEFYNANKESISPEDFYKMVNSKSPFIVTLCELDTES